MIGNPSAESGDRLAWEIRAVAERLRQLSPARLRTPLPPYPSREQAGRVLAQRLADAAAGVVARDSDQPPEWREIPEIEVFAVGEQVAVTGNDLVGELAALPATGDAATGDATTGDSEAGEAAGRVPVDIMIWTPSGRRPLSEVIDDLLTTLRELRLGL